MSGLDMHLGAFGVRLGVALIPDEPRGNSVIAGATFDSALTRLDRSHLRDPADGCGPHGHQRQDPTASHRRGSTPYVPLRQDPQARPRRGRRPESGFSGAAGGHEMFADGHLRASLTEPEGETPSRCGVTP